MVAKVVPPLKAFLEHPRRPEGTLTYHELQGFLYVVASAPTLVKPNEWLPAIFNDQSAGYKNLTEARAILAELTTLYNAINRGVFEGHAALPPDCRFRRNLLANLAPDAPISQWSRGFLTGHDWLEDVWNEYLPSELEDEFGAMLMTLGFFASPQVADAFVTETKAESLEELARTMRRLFRHAVVEYAQLGRLIDRVISEPPASHAASPPKIGRNEPCPCGSGRKYKKCCGASVH